ncbi:Hypothetical predicted protein [Mytilus galloprovincialis]|uniref:Mutator-like transposase domain-containing protein n=1 Tax=Mytilus galloprovincialis TaxID=29158 RepID=A0A8B6DIS4_MYTGA|nr:Hypothetical predicted protein [Mytilus galloprovincialis]
MNGKNMGKKHIATKVSENKVIFKNVKKRVWKARLTKGSHYMCVDNIKEEFIMGSKSKKNRVFGRSLEAMKVSSEGKTPIKLQTEVRSLGLASVMMAECQGCFKKFKFDTSPKVPGSKRYDVNVRAVWGSMVTGNGPAHLNELMATLNSPGLSQPTFTSIETDIGKWWHSILEREMMLAGQEERRLAIDRNDYHHEVPAITVIVDGGWSKRTHKHSYNAAGGVAIIIGKETKKLLHIGVRNKYCYILWSE